MLNTPIKAFTKPVTDQQITNASSPGVEPSDSLPEADIAGQFTRLMAKGSCFYINQQCVQSNLRKILSGRKKKAAIKVVQINCLKLILEWIGISTLNNLLSIKIMMKNIQASS